MADLTLPIQPAGLLVEVMIGVNDDLTQDLLQAGLPLVRPLKVTAFLDTGADVSGISRQIAQALKLMPVLTVQTTTGGGVIHTPCYAISLSFLDATGTRLLYAEPDLLVTEMATPPPNLDAFVGLDLILRCMLIVDGPNGYFTLRFPP
jgi:hypothetical protein